MRTRTTPKRIDVQLREGIKASGMSVNKLSKLAGIGSGMLSRFLNDNRSLRLNSAADVALGLGLELVGASERKISYFHDRSAANLEKAFQAAKKTIQVITTTMTREGSRNFVRAILDARNAAERAGRGLKEVTILASHPDNPFLRVRAAQLGVSYEKYKTELRDVLGIISHEFRGWPNCELWTYRDFPVQFWYRVDATIYVNIPSIVRHTRHNCLFGVPVDLPGVKKTFLAHFDKLRKKSKKFNA
ncbi:MAG: helix-turn-helix domain-containing protein [Gemmataceae bacterium]|nr:helix-turn-helix domain-containing protein [Gemmataceae bacterium]MCI0740408.1 helix-turn-helix domain-containing protein [Gemmataceae bacterium]